MHLEIMLLEFLFIILLEIYSITILKSILKTILIIIIIFLLTLFRMGRGQVQTPSVFCSYFFFSVRTAFKFFKFCFYALKCFLANFQGYSVFRSKVIPNCMKKSVKKGQKLSKSESDKKGHIKLPFFFGSNVSYCLGLKSCKVSSQ